MPLITIISNQKLDTSSSQLQTISTEMAQAIGKPESYVMVSLQHNPDMLFAGSSETLAYCEVKSLGLQMSQTAGLSETLCGLLKQLYGIPTKRIYIEFAAPERAFWGWNKSTF